MGRGGTVGSSVRIVLPEALRELAGGRTVVEVGLGAGAGAAGSGQTGLGAGATDEAPGSAGRAATAGARAGSVDDDRRDAGGGPGTVGGVLHVLRASHPGLHDRLMTEQGAPRPHVNIFMDGENIRFTGGLGTRVGKGGEILVLPAISGG